MTEDVKTLIQLAEIDGELDRLHAEEKTLTESVARSREEFERLTERGRDLSVEMREFEKELAVRNTRFKELEEKFKQAERKQANVTTVKQAEAVSRELADLLELKENEELEILLLEDKLTPLREKRKEIEEKREAAERHLRAREKESAGKIEVIRTLIERAKPRREELLPALEKKTRDRYERLRNTHHLNAVAELKDGQACGGCLEMVIPKVVVQVNAGHPAVCPHCGRFLKKAASVDEE